MFDGIEMNIENLKEGFKCGQKDLDTITDLSIIYKTELELKVAELESRVQQLEEEIKKN